MASNPSPWLSSWSDRLVRLRSTSACFRFVDLLGDGDYRMIVASSNAATADLKIFRGTVLESEVRLPDIPVSVCPFYMGNATPLLGVASGAFVYLYRDLRPYGKFAVPPVDIARVESETWESLCANAIDVGKAVAALAGAQDDGVRLSSRSLDLLAIPDAAMQAKFARSFREPPRQDTVITCMEPLAKGGPAAVTCLALGTEHGTIHVLDQTATKVGV